MDYAGKYVGGFVGMDENYTQGTTINIDGKDVKADGSFYINCYSAGEVGNILTVTDTSVASEREVTYTENDEGRDTTKETLLYYPTGGFAGVIAPDAYEKWYDKTHNHLSEIIPSGSSSGSMTLNGRNYNVFLPGDLEGKSFGYFSNCFYDMQTSAMREIAVGQENPKASSDGSGEKPAFSVTGITGLYTEESDVKDMDGLTDLPSKNHAMDSQKGDSTVWKYEKGYYPQLKSYMQFERKSDTDGAWYKLDGTQASDEEVKQFPFYMEETGAKTDGSETHEVVEVADNKTVLLTVYRYAQASTSTVFLDHWDYKMNIANGGLSTDNNWACGVEDNKMTYNEDTRYWEITYDNLEAGTYNFKVQANDTMTFNYGKNKFDGEDCTFTAQDGDTVVIKFKYTDLRSDNYRILADFYSSENGSLTLREENVWLGGLSEEAPAEVWGVVGSFDFAYGDNGSEDNYNITLKEDADVEITFNPNTSIISVASNPPEALETTTYVVTGTENLMGETWDTKAAVMSFNDSEGVCEYIKENVPSNDNYAYKIIEYGVDSGDNISFYLAGEKARYNIRFTYDPKTGVSTVDVIDIETGNICDGLIKPVKVTTYSVLGEEALTGYIWEGRTDNGATPPHLKTRKRRRPPD